MSHQRSYKNACVSFILTIFLCLIITPSYSHDLNGDGKIGVADAIYALQVATNSPEANRTRIDILPNGTPEQNGTELLRVLGEVSDASASNKYVLKLFPGTYNLVDDYLQMKEYVDIEGFSATNTIITSSNSSEVLTKDSCTVAGADNSTLRDLVIENNGGDEDSVGIFNSAVSPSIENIKVIVSGGLDWTCGIRNSSQSKAVINNVIIEVDGTGLKDIRGIQNYEANPTIRNVKITTNNSSYNIGILNYLSNPYMESIEIEASGGIISIGIKNLQSSPIMINISSTVSNASQESQAVLNYYNSSPTIKRLYAYALAENSSYGVSNDHYSHTVIEDSYISSKYISVNNFYESTLKIRNSVLVGRPPSSLPEDILCEETYDKSYQKVTPTCLYSNW